MFSFLEPCGHLFLFMRPKVSQGIQQLKPLRNLENLIQEFTNSFIDFPTRSPLAIQEISILMPQKKYVRNFYLTHLATLNFPRFHKRCYKFSLESCGNLGLFMIHKRCQKFSLELCGNLRDFHDSIKHVRNFHLSPVVTLGICRF